MKCWVQSPVLQQTNKRETSPDVMGVAALVEFGIFSAHVFQQLFYFAYNCQLPVVLTKQKKKIINKEERKLKRIYAFISLQIAASCQWLQVFVTLCVHICACVRLCVSAT
jgi:hypothetical protein